MNFNDEQIYRLVMERRDRSSGWRSNRWLTEWRPTERSQREERERRFCVKCARHAESAVSNCEKNVHEAMRLRCTAFGQHNTRKSHAMVGKYKGDASSLRSTHAVFYEMTM